MTLLQKEVMQKLSEKGADMEIENIHGETPYGECAFIITASSPRLFLIVWCKKILVVLVNTVVNVCVM